MQNRQNNGVGFFGISVSSWCNSARGPGAMSKSQNRVVKKHHWAAMTFSPGKVGEYLCTQSCTKLDAN